MHAATRAAPTCCNERLLIATKTQHNKKRKDKYPSIKKKKLTRKAVGLEMLYIFIWWQLLRYIDVKIP